MTRFHEPDLTVDPNSPFVRDASNKLARRAYWMDMTDPTLLMVMTITRKAIELAKRGDLVALRLCLERIVPPRRDRPVNFTLPEINSVDHATRAMATITTAVANGELTPAEAVELSRVIEGYVKALEATEIERRLRLLEERAIRDAK